MPHFWEPRRGVYVSTSYKVMYSTLASHPGLRAARDSRAASNLWRARVGLESRPHFWIVRDPYARLESFFRDKFRKHPSEDPPCRADGWQPCQRLFFPALGLAAAPSETIREALLEVSFDRFVRLLPEHFQRDAHLWPQQRTRTLTVRGAPVARLPLSAALRLESSRDMDRLRSALGLDPARSLNVTGSAAAPCEWTPELRAIANRIYRRDFRALGYPAREA